MHSSRLNHKDFLSIVNNTDENYPAHVVSGNDQYTLNLNSSQGSNNSFQRAECLYEGPLESDESIGNISISDDSEILYSDLCETDFMEDINSNFGNGAYDDKANFEKSSSSTRELDVDALENKLKDWTITYKLNRIQVSSLLSILKPYHSELPSSSKTLLKVKKNWIVRDMLSAKGIIGKFPSATEKEIFKCIHNNLATAGDREGGRKERKSKKKNENTDVLE